MNGPIVDSEASLNPTYDVSACCASLRLPGMGGLRQESDFRAIRDRAFPTNAEVTIGKDGEPVLRKSAAQQITDTGRKAGFGRPAGPSRGSSVATRPP